MRHLPPRTSREALEVIGGEPHALHTVMLARTIVLKDPPSEPVVQVECSCGVEWRIDRKIAHRLGTTLDHLQQALRNAPLSKMAPPVRAA